MAEHEQNSECSDNNNFVCEEEKIHKLFPSCNGNEDGFLESQDLISVCRELNIEGSVEEFAHEVGLDTEGCVSVFEFLRQRVSSKHNADPSHQQDYPASSNNSLGGPSGSKNDRWEFDSGARDLSPEPHTLQKLMEVSTAESTGNSTNSTNLLQLANKLHLAALSSLRSEILDLSSRLQSVTEERDLLEKSLAQSQSIVEASVAQQYEDRLAKLQSVINELRLKLDCNKSSPQFMSNKTDGLTVSVDTEQLISDYFDNLYVERGEDLPEHSGNDVACNTTDTLLMSSLYQDKSESSPEKVHSSQEKIEELMQNIIGLQAENAKLHSKLIAKDIEIRKIRSSLINSKENKNSKVKDGHHNIKGQNERTTVTPSHQSPPIPKVAERVRLRRMGGHVTGSEITSLGVSHTEVAEHLVSGVLEQCNLLEMGTDHRKIEIETERLISKLENTRAFNNLLQSSLEEVKSHCERLTLLVGKYENNAIALQLALECCDRIIRAYEELVSNFSIGRGEKKEEKRLLQLIDGIKKERSTIEGAVVQLESYVESPVPQPQIPTQARKLDLETAVLIQEVMSMREEKADLNAIIYRLEKEKEGLELKLTTMETQQQTQLATVQHLKMLQESFPNNEENCNVGQNEKMLRVQLKEMAAALERVSRNAEIRQKQHAEMMVELRATNNTLLRTIEKNRHKYEARVHRLEAQMLTMVSRHAAQVQTLKERILHLLDNKNNEQQW